MGSDQADPPDNQPLEPRSGGDLDGIVALLRHVYYQSPMSTIGYYPDGRMAFMNPAAERFWGIPLAVMIGPPRYNLRADAQNASIIPLFDQAVAGTPAETPVYQYDIGSLAEGVGVRWARNVFAPWRDESGAVRLVVAQHLDMTAIKLAEEERAALQEQVIRAQQSALRELSTPLIPIADGVVAMPLIGNIDSIRAQMVMESLLGGVTEARADTAIIDITGVPVVDTQVANALLHAARAIRLLGARVILTGIRPEVAQTLVGLGVDMSGISTRGTFQSGIADALRRWGATGVRRP